MLAERLREWEERKISEGLQRGCQEGLRRGREEGLQRGREDGLEYAREEERQLLRSQVAHRFGEAVAEAIWPLLGSMRDAALLAEVGISIVECKTGDALLEGARDLAEPNSYRA